MNLSQATDILGNALRLNLDNITYVVEEGTQYHVYFVGQSEPLQLEKAQNEELWERELSRGISPVRPFRKGGHVSHG
jgi:hypothetical protein